MGNAFDVQTPTSESAAGAEPDETLALAALGATMLDECSNAHPPATTEAANTTDNAEALIILQTCTDLTIL